MKQLLYTGLFVIISGHCFGQVGQTAANIAIDIGTSTLPETQALASMRLSQDEVLKYSKKIAQNTAALLVLKEAELKALSDTPDGIEQTTPWKTSVYAIDAIIQYNTNSIQLIQDFPDASDIGVEAMALITENAYASMSDIAQIVSGGDDNLMHGTDRFKFIDKVNERLLLLVEVSRFVNTLIRTSVVLNEDVPSDYSYDVTEDYGNILNKIENFIQE